MSDVLAIAGLAASGLGGARLDGVDLTLPEGSITALLADSPASAGLVVAVLGGLIAPTAGRISLHGTPVRAWSPRHALCAGIGSAWRPLGLLPGLPVWRSLVLGGALDRRPGLAPLRESVALAGLALETARLGLGEDELRQPPEALPVDRHGLLLVARAFGAGGTAVLLDEPTLDQPIETAALVLARASEARAAGTAVLLATTNVQHAWAVADRFILLYRGRILAVLGRTQTRREELYRAMFGAQDYQDLALQLQRAGAGAAAPTS